MAAAAENAQESSLWSDEVLGLRAVVDIAGSVRLTGADQLWNRLVPLVEVVVTGQGRMWSGERFIDTAVGGRLVLRGHETAVDGAWRRTTIGLADPETGLAAHVTLSTVPGSRFLRSQVRLVNEGQAPLHLESVSSLTLGGVTDRAGGLDGLTLHWADNDWLAECRWRRAAFRDLVVPLNRAAHGHEGRGCFERYSQGSWSTGRHLPVAAVTDGRGGAWLWQIESGAGWRYEIGEREGAAYLALFGPDDAHHQWRRTLAPGEEFTTVPAALVRVAAGAEAGGGAGGGAGAGIGARVGGGVKAGAGANSGDEAGAGVNAGAEGGAGAKVGAEGGAGVNAGVEAGAMAKAGDEGGAMANAGDEGGAKAKAGDEAGAGVNAGAEGGAGAKAVAKAGGGSGGGAGGLDAAFGELTAYRRRIRRDHPDHRNLPVIYNDYMNTLMGDPTTDKLLPLVEAAGAVGAEVFVVDAGWYDDDAEGWWDAVGAWEPAARRFPGGIQEVLDAIGRHGMTPGLWLEPEVVGVRSPLAAALPPEAFFRRGGVRLTEHGRHHLDLRHPAARAHLDRVVDRIVGEWGVGYLKLDYNINIGPGTENGAESAGAGLLGHHRAHLDWLASLLDRHPGLVLENCGSGGLRMDYAQLAVAQVQSTSDQQDPRRSPPIAVAAATAVAPEQAAVWAYPQPDFGPDEIAFTMTTALLGRVHLSGFLDRMNDEQFARVRSAVDVYKRIRPEIGEALPMWPLGLPGWEDTWLAYGLRGASATYLALWRRDPAATGRAEARDGSAPAGAGSRAAARDRRAPADAGSDSRTLRVPHLLGARPRIESLYPADSDATADWNAADATLTVSLPRADTAVLLRLGTTPRE
ncbi:alpha-galactosidase [Streptomyces sp. NBC_00704]|uniref:glycoside hydrolase family 36 protein n=1 Tax=Streptomyces sp. NBC_00704 TaxID=2975809 RepID=UPI002E37E3B4|nr:glycoside hydrolase family 36 protein [Streptomyces sp. NBC_00704]